MKWIILFFAVILTAGSSLAAEDALDEVNALRAKRGLPPFIRDDGLTEGAKKIADYRAANLIFGHVMNGSYALDHSFVPAGTRVDTAGCAAYPPEYGWLSCAVNEAYTYAGAAYAIGSDGKRYMHLFLSGGSAATQTTSYAAYRRVFRRR
jgi:hypothetical protein